MQEPIPSVSQGRSGTAVCTLLSAQPPPSAPVQPVSKPPNSKWSRLTPAIRAPVCEVTIQTADTVRPGPSGALATRTVQVRDANGSFGVVSVDTTKSDNIHAIQVQIAPSEVIK